MTFRFVSTIVLVNENCPEHDADSLITCGQVIGSEALFTYSEWCGPWSLHSGGYFWDGISPKSPAMFRSRWAAQQTHDHTIGRNKLKSARDQRSLRDSTP